MKRKEVSMWRHGSAVAALSVGLLWVGTARAQTPFGGDDTGFIPPAKSATAKCEAGAAKAADKLIACILKCHASRASGKLADDTAEDACEKTLAGKSCTALFAASIAKLKACPPCINGTTMGNLAGLTESLLDGNNSTVYCDTSSGTPFGGDDTGDIPTAKSASAKCEAGAAKATGKLIACIDKCHASRASGKLADDTAEDACEKTLAGKSCAAKFTLAISKLSGCPSCINGTTMGNLAGLTETLLDGNNATVYCSGGAPTTTTTITTSSTTTTTCPAAAPPLVRGSLPSTVGRFTYNAEVGLPSANDACAANFACTHACTLEELETAPTSELMGLKDTTNMTVTSFWAIDPSAAPLEQCNDDVSSHLNWEYATAHTMSRGEKVDLNPDGTLGGLDATPPPNAKPDAAHMMLQCNFSGNAWVGCCR